MKKFSEKINESHKYEYGCLMLKLDIKNWSDVLEKIETEDIYNKEGFGEETEPHVTILFGFIDKKLDLNKLYDTIKDYKNFNVSISGIDMFDNPEYDVLKFDIESEKIIELNSLCTKEFEYHSDFPDYHPHMTVAYLKKGTGSKYSDLLKDVQLNINKETLSYSRQNKNKILFELN